MCGNASRYARCAIGAFGRATARGEARGRGREGSEVDDVGRPGRWKPELCSPFSLSGKHTRRTPRVCRSPPGPRRPDTRRRALRRPPRPAARTPVGVARVWAVYATRAHRTRTESRHWPRTRARPAARPTPCPALSHTQLNAKLAQLPLRLSPVHHTHDTARLTPSATHARRRATSLGPTVRRAVWGHESSELPALASGIGAAHVHNMAACYTPLPRAAHAASNERGNAAIRSGAS